MSWHRLSAVISAPCSEEVTMLKKRTIIFCLLGLLVLGVLVPSSPMFRKIPGRDSGIYLYMGQEILDSKIPYRDAWDHKPPAIYFINALGLFLGNGSSWGVWLLEVVSLSFAAIIGFILLDEAFGVIPAMFGSVAWLVSLFIVLEGGNLTEEYALPFQFAALSLFVTSELLRRYSWRGYVIGLTSGAAFFLRQNLIGVGASIVIYLLLTRGLSRNCRRLVWELATIFGGVFSVIAIVVIYFAAHGGLGDFWDQAFRYNFVYSDVGLPSRLRAFAEGLRVTSQSGICILSLTAWLVVMWCVLQSKVPLEYRKPLVEVSLIGLPIEFLLASISGRWYPHYYMAWLPMCSILTGLFAYSISNSSVSRVSGEAKVQGVVTPTVWLIALLLAMSVQPIGRMLYEIARSDHIRYQTVEYIRKSTMDRDYVLMWGDEPSINFLSNRRAPTRFFEQYPLYTPGYQNPKMIEEFSHDIQFNKPSLIIDTSAGNTIVPPLDAVARKAWLDRRTDALLLEMEHIFQYISSHYEVIGMIGEWPIYGYKGIS